MKDNLKFLEHFIRNPNPKTWGTVRKHSAAPCPFADSLIETEECPMRKFNHGCCPFVSFVENIDWATLALAAVQYLAMMQTLNRDEY